MVNLSNLEQLNVYFAVTCGGPENVPYSTHTNTGVNVGDTVTYTCVRGYTISGQSSNTSTAACGLDGNWAGVPTCIGQYISGKE